MKRLCDRNRWDLPLLLLHGVVVMHLFFLTPTLLKYPQVLQMPRWETDGITPGSVPTAWLVNGYLLFGKAGFCILGCWVAMDCVHRDRFRPVLPLVAAVAVSSYFLRRESWEVIPQFLTPVLMLLILSLALLKPLEDSSHKLLRGLARDRKHLATVAFWSLTTLAVSHVTVPDEGVAYLPYYVPVLILTLPLASALRKPKVGLTTGGWLGLAVIFGMSLVLCSFGGMVPLLLMHYGAVTMCYVPMVIVEVRYEHL